MDLNNPLKILLLDDHGLVRAGFKALLKESVPYAKVYEAASYVQALAVLDREDIDFAFLDFKLASATNKSGLDVLHYIRQQALATRAIMLSGGESASGHLAKELVVQCITAGAFGYIPKAMEGDSVLREAFEAVLQGRVFLPLMVFEQRVETAVLPRHLEVLALRGKALDVLYYLCQGDVNKTIAMRMQLAEGTIRDYVSLLLKQFKVKNRTQLLIEIAHLGLVVPKPTVAAFVLVD
ncbi:MAG: response regulator transcription factor [Methylococcales bacterium]|nr:response regulator transcription factor [Methylococcales bacterium]